MKKEITQKQLNELSKKGKERLWKWCKEKLYLSLDMSKPITLYHPDGKDNSSYKLPLLSIGPMIEFLLDHDKLDGDEDGRPVLPVYRDIHSSGSGDMICDALWEACKEILK